MEQNLFEYEHMTYSDALCLRSKIVSNTICVEPYFCLDQGEYYSENCINMISHKCEDELFYLLGILNTHVGKYLWIEFCMIETSSTNRAYCSTKQATVQSFPLPFINAQNAPVKARIIEVTKSIYSLLKNDINAKYDVLQAELEYLVYSLYRINELPEDVQAFVRTYKLNKKERLKVLDKYVQTLDK